MLASNANSSSPTLSHALQYVKADRIGVICQGVSSAPHFLLARLQGYSFQCVFQLVFPHTPCSFPLPASCRLLSRHSVGTTWEFSLEQFGIAPTYQVTYRLCGRMKVPHLISIRPMECWLATLNESSAILSHALEQIHAAGIVISKSASIACHFLLSRLQGHSFQFVFQKVFPAYTLKLPSICVLPTLSIHSVRTSWEF